MARSSAFYTVKRRGGKENVSSRRTRVCPRVLAGEGRRAAENILFVIRNMPPCCCGSGKGNCLLRNRKEGGKNGWDEEKRDRPARTRWCGQREKESPSACFRITYREGRRRTIKRRARPAPAAGRKDEKEVSTGWISTTSSSNRYKEGGGGRTASPPRPRLVGREESLA